MESAGNAIAGVGKKMSIASTAVTGLGVAAVKTKADFDSAMSQVAAVSGATGDDLQELRDKAREMGEKTKFSASEAAEAMNYMAMAGWKTKDILNGKSGTANKVSNSTASFKVQVSISNLNIRKGPGTNYARTGKKTGKGVFTITQTKSGTGSKAGWEKLKSGEGWISLDYAKRI